MTIYILIGITLAYFRFRKGTDVDMFGLLVYILLWPIALLADW